MRRDKETMCSRAAITEFIPRDAAWAVCMRRNSPGDFFRLVHGCCCAFQGRRNVVYLADQRLFELGGGLLDDHQPNILHNGRDVIVARERAGRLPAYWLVLCGLTVPWNEPDGEYGFRQFLAAWNSAFGSGGIGFCCDETALWTMYSSESRSPKGKTLAGVDEFAYKEWTVRRIDTKVAAPRHLGIDAEQWRFFQEPFGISLPPRDMASRKIAIVLRKEGVADWRYSCDYHEQRERFAELEQRLSVEFWWAGLRRRQDYPTQVQDHCIPYKCLGSFRAQIEHAAGFALAAGVNSSALDVFSAAGIPVLRECEFQEHAHNAWPGGRDYNRFLGLAPNLGLGITRDQYELGTRQRERLWPNESRFFGALEKMILRIDDFRGVPRAAQPRHAVVPADTDNIDEILDHLLA